MPPTSSSSLILTATLTLTLAGMAATSGMDVYAASFLIPLGVLFYTLIGGLKATFLASCTPHARRTAT